MGSWWKVINNSFIYVKILLLCLLRNSTLCALYFVKQSCTAIACISHKYRHIASYWLRSTFWAACTYSVLHISRISDTDSPGYVCLKSSNFTDNISNTVYLVYCDLHCKNAQIIMDQIYKLIKDLLLLLMMERLLHSLTIWP